jgi:hypothetical protein
MNLFRHEQQQFLIPFSFIGHWPLSFECNANKISSGISLSLSLSLCLVAFSLYVCMYLYFSACRLSLSLPRPFSVFPFLLFLHCTSFFSKHTMPSLHLSLYVFYSLFYSLLISIPNCALIFCLFHTFSLRPPCIFSFYLSIFLSSSLYFPLSFLPF